jgi:serine/threonine-protein kinase
LNADLPELPVREGDVVAGRYRVERVIGAGGMGAVVAATHVELEQQVAIKFLLPGSAAKPVIVARFEREARAAVRLRSEHVGHVIDVGKLPGGEPFIVMEYLEGQDLGALIERRGRLEVAVAVDYVLQACVALAEAHSLGIVHRDIKPANLFLTRRVGGRELVKVLDFGISKMPEEGVSDLTGTGEVMGSPHYMSPEQLHGARDVDGRTDIWSMGAVLYKLLTGEVPFDGENMAQLCARILIDPPAPLRSLRDDVPSALEAVVLRCLNKRVEERYPSVAELARDLDPFARVDATRAADRVRVAGEKLPAPGLSETKLAAASPAGVVASTADGWSETETLVRPRRGRRTAVAALALAVAGAGGAALYGARGHWMSPPRGSATGSTAAPSAPSNDATPSLSTPSSSSTTPSSSTLARPETDAAAEAPSLGSAPAPVGAAPPVSSSLPVAPPAASTIRRAPPRKLSAKPTSPKSPEKSADDDAPDLRQ